MYVMALLVLAFGDGCVVIVCVVVVCCYVGVDCVGGLFCRYACCCLTRVLLGMLTLSHVIL